MSTVKPNAEGYLWVVRSLCGRDRFRYFLAFPCVENGCAQFPSIYTVNGRLHPVERPKKKHICHVEVVAEVSDAEKKQLFSDYSNKMVAILIEKYDKYGEL